MAWSVLTIGDADNAKAVHGVPISLQLVGRRLAEEKVIAMTKVVLDAIA